MTATRSIRRAIPRVVNQVFDDDQRFGRADLPTVNIDQMRALEHAATRLAPIAR